MKAIAASVVIASGCLLTATAAVGDSFGRRPDFLFTATGPGTIAVGVVLLVAEFDPPFLRASRKSEERHPPA